jgi:3-methylcrotonyl-CoA carboxylase beta subunit
MHSSLSGVTDHVAEDDRHALAITRELVRDLGRAGGAALGREAQLPPRLDPREIYGLISRDPRSRPTRARSCCASSTTAASRSSSRCTATRC